MILVVIVMKWHVMLIHQLMDEDFMLWTRGCATA